MGGNEKIRSLDTRDPFSVSLVTSMPSRMLAMAASEAAAAAEAEAAPAWVGETVPPFGLPTGEDGGGSWRDRSALKRIEIQT